MICQVVILCSATKDKIIFCPFFLSYPDFLQRFEKFCRKDFMEVFKVGFFF